MSDTTFVRMSGQIIQSLSDTIIYEKDVNFIKESIISYLEARSSVSEDLPQSFLDSFKQLVQKLVQIQDSLKQEVKPPVDPPQNSVTIVADEQNSQQEEEVLDDKHLVQIQADRKEIYRRISSFVTRKRKEVDEWNVQEFCNHHPVGEDNPLWDNDDFVSCARVDAVFIPRTGSKSHVKVSKVNNVLGPQIQLQNTASMSTKTEVTAEEFSRFESDSIEERLRNMESHLKLKTDSSARNNIYARIKQLEDRILYLESCSPEYLNFLGTKIFSPEKQTKTEEPVFFTSNTARLHKRIQTLKEELKWKSRKLASESPS